MKINTAKFIISAPTLKECPILSLPEFALLGRSNVGKSSFINSLVNINGLAKTSNTPGKTRLINLFNIDDKFIFADLPGYGYAKVSAKMQNEWKKNLENYLLKRANLLSAIVIVDVRHSIQNNDMQMVEWLKYNKIPFFVVANKVDQITRSQLTNSLKMFEDNFNVQVFPFSKMNNSFNVQILNYIDGLIKSYN